VDHRDIDFDITLDIASDIARRSGAKRRIDRWNRWAREKVGRRADLRVRGRAQAARQSGKFFIRGRHQRHIRRDHDDIVRIVGWLRVRR
jgi:hypothetical protein